MKQVLFASLAALMLSPTALGQEDWVYIACELGFRSMSVNPSPDGSYALNLADLPPATSDETRIYRFNSNQIDAFEIAMGAWRPLCHPEGEWTQAECELNANRLYNHRSRASGAASFSVTMEIARLTGAIWIRENTFTAMPPALTRVGTGSCAPTTDPAAAARRF